MKKNYSRREMIKITALAAGGLCTCRVFGAAVKLSDCCNTPDLEKESYIIQENRIIIDLTKAPSLAESGHAAVISKPDRKIELIIVRSEENKFFALSRLCAHGRQILSYNRHRKLLQCNSYNHSLFHLDGQVYKGPAPTPLDSYKLETHQEKITVFL
ncbi:Rieske 2Fe-2S domain-containing protein [candidate division KSB1 bacterium]|nr:Rieske 2Fe-2S domain-containing protein [candidate division KSB1 bacterium]